MKLEFNFSIAHKLLLSFLPTSAFYLHNVECSSMTSAYMGSKQILQTIEKSLYSYISTDDMLSSWILSFIYKLCKYIEFFTGDIWGEGEFYSLSETL